jgi:hypothetical protein
MKILKGFVLGVVDKGTPEKPYALVGINEISQNRNGFEETNLVEFMVTGQQFKNGLHNAYRSQTGAEVYAPYGDEINSFNNKTDIRYTLRGVPLRIQEVMPVLEPRPAPTAAPTPVQQPEQKRA